MIITISDFILNFYSIKCEIIFWIALKIEQIIVQPIKTFSVILETARTRFEIRSEGLFECFLCSRPENHNSGPFFQHFQLRIRVPGSGGQISKVILIFQNLYQIFQFDELSRTVWTLFGSDFFYHKLQLKIMLKKITILHWPSLLFTDL